MPMHNKHYVVLPAFGTGGATFDVVCLAHSVTRGVKREEADAIANALNLESCNHQVGFGET